MTEKEKMLAGEMYDPLDPQLAELLADQIAYRIRLYSYSICKSTDNYLKWLQEDYERKLMQSFAPHFVVS